MLKNFEMENAILSSGGSLENISFEDIFKDAVESEIMEEVDSGGVRDLQMKIWKRSVRSLK